MMLYKWVFGERLSIALHVLWRLMLESLPNGY